MTTLRRMFSRRAFLRGAGVALALPALDAMVPSFVRAEGKAPPRRLVAVQTNQGIMPHLFFPDKPGKDYAPSPYLEILRPLRADLTVFSGLSHPGVDGGHSNEACFLTGAPHPAGAGFRNTVSLDQFAAEKIGGESRYPSLVVAASNAGERGMSFTRAGVSIPPECSPARLYRKLFVQGTAREVEARVQDLRAGRSLLDTVRERSRRLEQSVGAADRRRLDEYFASVRELEQQLLQAESWERKPKPKVDVAEPGASKEGGLLITRLRSTYDVLKLALETDSTRIVSLFIQPLGVISEIPGVEHETHSLTHHGNRAEMIAELRKVEEAQFQALRDFLLGLKGVNEGEGSLLDRTSVLYGTCMGNANGHTNSNLPMLLAGGGFRHGQHLAFDAARKEPLGNLFVSLLQRMGIEAGEFSSGRGRLRGLELA
jgi:hypothetical protein